MTTSAPSAAATGQPVPNGPRSADRRSRFELRDRAAHGADIAHGVHEDGRVRAVAADADRHLADAEGVEHVELPGLEAGRCAACAATSSSVDGIGQFAAHPADAIELRTSVSRRRGAGTAAAISALPVDIEDLQPRRVQALRRASAGSASSSRSRDGGRPRTCRAGRRHRCRSRASSSTARASKHPAIGRDQPGGADDLALAERREHDRRPCPGATISSATWPWRIRKNSFGGLAFAKQVFARHRSGDCARSRRPAALCSAAKPAKNGMLLQDVLKLLHGALPLPLRRRPDRRRLLGDVDADRAPGDAAAAADAARRAELVDPVRQLVGHPLPVARARRCAHAAAVDDRRNPG